MACSMAPRFASIFAGTALLLYAVCAPARAQEVRTVCGVRQGTAGNAFLVGQDGGDVLVLAEQGGSQRLLDQADRLAGPQPGGERGTQTGERYCLRVRYDARGRPAEVLQARRAPR